MGAGLDMISRRLCGAIPKTHEKTKKKSWTHPALPWAYLIKRTACVLHDELHGLIEPTELRAFLVADNISNGGKPSNVRTCGISRETNAAVE